MPAFPVLPQERQDAEAAALRAVTSAEASLRQAQVAFEQARQAEGTGVTSAEAELRDAEEQLRAVERGATSYELADVLLVPNAALLPRGAGRVVQVPDGAGGVREVAVETGLSDGMQTVMVDGLDEGDVIVAVPGDGPRAPAGPFGP